VSKDAINRHKLLMGDRIHFMNGFNAYAVNTEPLVD
jgi:hypothetical protein